MTARRLMGALAVAATVAGCGGSGGTASSTPTPSATATPGPTPTALTLQQGCAYYSRVTAGLGSARDAYNSAVDKENAGSLSWRTPVRLAAAGAKTYLKAGGALGKPPMPLPDELAGDVAARRKGFLLVSAWLSRIGNSNSRDDFITFSNMPPMSQDLQDSYALAGTQIQLTCG